MPKTEIPLSSHNDDIATARAFWWEANGVFIEQTEKENADGAFPRQILNFGREAVPGLIAALQKFMAGHDSDCATHNEPAMPNGPCDCSLSR